MPRSLVLKLERDGPLSFAEKEVALGLPEHIRHVPARGDIISDGGSSDALSLITEGFACRYKLLDDGRRQILAFLVPGDFCDLRSLLLHQMDAAVAALSHCQIASIPHQRLFDAMEKHTRLALALWRETMFDAAISQQWLINVGRRCAYSRLAHLLCEVWFRLQTVQHAHDRFFDFPVTQTDLADALGLSVVHVNRTLQHLRADGLLNFRASVVTVLDWPRLREAGQFDPAYLRHRVTTLEPC